MTETNYHYTECGLDNIYLVNGYKTIETAEGQAVSIHDVDGLHKAIGLNLVMAKKNLSPKEIRFLRNELLMSQSTLGKLLGVSEQAVRRWETGKTTMPKPSEFLLRLVYADCIKNRNNNVSSLLREIADLEDNLIKKHIFFVDTKQGWQSAA